MGLDEKIILSEAKDLHADIIVATRETRTKCWQLLAIAIAIEGFSAKTMLTKESLNTSDWVLLTASTVLLVLLMILMLNALFPSNFYLNGSMPEDLSDKESEKDVAEMYNRMILSNDQVLKDMSKAYKRGLYTYTFLAVGVAAFLFVIHL